MAAEAKIRITAQDDSAAAFRKAQANVQQLAGVAARLGGAFGVGAISVAGILALGKASIDSLDALNDLKDASGSSIENLSALEDVAERTGTQFDTVAAGLVKFNGVLKDIKPGNDADRALQALGLSAENLKRQDPAEALRLTAVALSRYADDGEKARLVQELFGKSTRQTAAFLKDLAEQGKLNGTVTTQQALEAEKFNKELFALQKNAKDFGRSLTGDVVTGLNAMIAKFRQAKEEGTGIFASINSLAAAEEKKKTQRAGGAILPDNESAAESARLLRRPSVNIAPEKKLGGGGGGGAKADPLAEAKRFLESLQKQLEKTQDLSVAEQVLLDIQKGRLGTVTPALQAQLIQTAQQIDAAIELEKRTKETTEENEKSAEAARKTADEYQKFIDGLLDDTPTRKLEEQRKAIEALTAEFQKGAISEQLYLEAVAAKLNLTGEGFEEMSTFAQEAAKNIQDALGDTIANTLQGNFEDIADNFTKLINRMVAEAAAAQIMESLFGKADSKGGSRSGGAFSGVLENIFGDLFSFDGGGDTGRGARTGGLDGKGGFLAVMHPQERVIDYTKGQSGGNTVNVSITQQFAPGTTQQTALQAATAARRQLESAGRNL